jgi:hypothetical protein
MTLERNHVSFLKTAIHKYEPPDKLGLNFLSASEKSNFLTKLEKSKIIEIEIIFDFFISKS